MPRYHINPTTGNPNMCKANKGNCPFGGHGEHFVSKEAARDIYELVMTAPEDDLTGLQREMKKKFSSNAAAPFDKDKALQVRDHLEKHISFAAHLGDSSEDSHRRLAYGEVSENMMEIMTEYPAGFQSASDVKKAVASLRNVYDAIELKSWEQEDSDPGAGTAWAEAAGSLLPLLESDLFIEAGE